MVIFDTFDIKYPDKYSVSWWSHHIAQPTVRKEAPTSDTHSPTGRWTSRDLRLLIVLKQERDERGARQAGEKQTGAIRTEERQTVDRRAGERDRQGRNRQRRDRKLIEGQGRNRNSKHRAGQKTRCLSTSLPKATTQLCLSYLYLSVSPFLLSISLVICHIQISVHFRLTSV